MNRRGFLKTLAAGILLPYIPKEFTVVSPPIPTGSEGGYLVPVEFYEALMSKTSKFWTYKIPMEGARRFVQWLEGT
jgi:hypothetical protein